MVVVTGGVDREEGGPEESSNLPKIDGPSEWRRIKRIYLPLLLYTGVVTVFDRITQTEPQPDLLVMVFGWVVLTVPATWAGLHVWRLRSGRPRPGRFAAVMAVTVGAVGALIALKETGVWMWKFAYAGAWLSWSLALYLGAVWITEERKSVRIYFGPAGTLLFVPMPKETRSRAQ